MQIRWLYGKHDRIERDSGILEAENPEIIVKFKDLTSDQRTILTVYAV